MPHVSTAIRPVGPIFAALLLAFAMTAAAGAADLPGYVERPDPSFAWEVERAVETPLGTVEHVDLVSQTWREIPWRHQFRIYTPKDYACKNVMLLFITGGSSTSKHKPEDDLQAFALAAACDARVAVLPQVPNQPLLGDRTEDDLIAETFVNFLKTGEQDWPLLQPMVKSAVAAMDAAQQWAEKTGEPVERFVVTGASKRGWTTWLTGAVDDRVAAIAPMVIPTLNMKANTENQMALWGKYSEQIEDYTTRGLTRTFEEPGGEKLWEMVDPYFYLDEMDKPVLQINGTNDRYWTHDSTRFFWDKIKGPSRLVYLPNAGHGLEEHRDYAINGVGALLRHVATGRTLPDFSWKALHEDGTIGLAVEPLGEVRPVAMTAWVARSTDRDFRDDPWEPLATDAERPGLVVLETPAEGSVALLYDLTFEVDGLTYHLTTPIHEFRADPAEDTSGGRSRR